MTIDLSKNRITRYVLGDVILPLHWKHDKDDVILDPQVFRHARRVLKFKPGVDLFASDFHHQLPRYYALEADPNAAGRDAFTANWLLELQPYINTPWYLIPECLDKIRADQAEVMMVVPKWETVAYIYCHICCPLHPFYRFGYTNLFTGR